MDTLKTNKSRTFPLVPELVPVVERWTEGKAGDEWLFAAPQGGPLNEGNWKRTVKWTLAIRCINRPSLRVHDLRHTAASMWLGAGADPKVVQRILGHASAATTMDLYGHLIDNNLWDAANRVGRGVAVVAGAQRLAPDSSVIPPTMTLHRLSYTTTRSSMRSG